MSLAAAPAARPVALEKAGTWVKGPVWDGLWILNFLWLLPIAYWLMRDGGDEEGGALDRFYFVLTALFWVGHRFSSTWLAYFTTAYRPVLKAEPVRFVVVPALVTIGLFALLLPADGALPWTRAQRVMGLAIVDYLFVTYHFAAQHFGVLSLYRSRAGRTRSERDRRLDRAYALGVGGVLVIVAEALRGDVFFQEVWVDGWLPPAWLAAHEGTIRLVVTVLLALAAATLLVREFRQGRPSLARGLYVVGLALMALLALYSRRPFLFVFLWTVQHWVAAVGLATRVARKEPVPTGRGPARLWHLINRHPVVLMLVLVGVSVLLLPVMEVEAVDAGGITYGDKLFPALAEALRTSTWVPALIALGFATAFCHYLLDRAVYRMSDPRVRQAAAGLLER